MLGSGRNWKSFAKKFIQMAEKVTGSPRRALLVDIRCHGNSSGKEGLERPHNMESAAKDFVRTIEWELSRLKGSRLEGLCGHSLGGKVVMQYLRQVQLKAEEKGGEENISISSANSSSRNVLTPSLTWVLDSVPTAIEDGNTLVSDTESIISRVSKVPLETFHSQSEVMSHLQDIGLSTPIAMWICSSLAKERRREKGGEDAHQTLRWKFNVEGASSLFQSFKETSCMEVLENPPRGTKIHM